METGIELIMRESWLKNRVQSCIDEMQKLKEIGCWDTYRSNALMLSQELNYAVTEWEKYYP